MFCNVSFWLDNLDCLPALGQLAYFTCLLESNIVPLTKNFSCLIVVPTQALYDTFSLFGNILSCKVATDDAGESKGYGYVHYETGVSANMAIAKINGMLIAGKQVIFPRRKGRLLFTR